nr:phage tail spike protein [Streptococcus anginosus]
MLLTIHDANLQKVAFIDNNKQATLNYYNDTWTRSLETGSSTFEFTVFKKAIQSDTATQKTYNLLNEKAFVSFKYNGKSYVFSVMTVEEDEYTIKCYCENLNLELINEYTNPYKSDKAMSFVEYCNAMDLLNFTHLSVGINEIADQKRTLEWEGQDTKLARLLSLAKKFDAEIDFETQLNADSTIKSFKVNVYHEHDDEHQGVGRVRNDVQLIYRKNLKSITRKIDKTGIYTMVVPTGKRTVKNGKGEEVEQIVTIGDLKPPYFENNKDGVCEFYQNGNALCAPIAAQMYPSTFTSGTQRDQWIRKDLEVDSDNPTVIRAAGIKNLKKNAYPALSYEVDGFLDVEIGDTCKIYDDGFVQALLVQARVSVQKISFTKPETNKTTFSNFKELERNLSAGIKAAFERLLEASKSYTIKLSTDNGVMFKNNTGQTIVTPTLYKGGKIISNDVTWRWLLNGNVTTGMTYLIKGSSITNTATLSVAAYIGNNEVARDELTFVNVNDGQNGAKGEKGEPGPQGKDGNFKGTVGGRNYIRHYDFDGLLPFSFAGSEWTFERIQDPTAKSGWALKATNVKGNDGGIYKYLFDLRGEEWQGKQMVWSVDIKSNRTDISLYNIGFEAGGNITSGVKLSDKWQRISKAFIVKFDTYWSFVIYGFGWNTGDVIYIRDPQLEDGTIDTTPKAAPEDVQDRIASKADNKLTQEQLNKLSEKNNLMQAELEAKASLDTLNKIVAEYNSYTLQNDKDKLQSEKELTSLSQRLIASIKNLKDMAERWNFLDRYFQVGNEGIVFGEKNGNTCTKMSSNRFSIFSAGNEVMYISQGTLFIENGIFSKAIQIGRFREEQYHLNPDMNVIRYVGGR